MIKKTIVAGIFLGLLSGCQSMKNNEVEHLSLIGNWKIESIMGQATPSFSEAELIFSADGKLAGNNSCNNFFGSYKVDGTQLTLVPKGNTMKACVDVLMAQEQAFNKVLPQVTSAKQTAIQLSLQNKEGHTVMTLQKI